MFSIRRGTFETNSSSTHSISIYTDKEWKDYKSKEDDLSYLLDDEDKFMTIDEVINELLHSDWGIDAEYGEKLKSFMNGRNLEDCLEEEFEDYDSLDEFLSDHGYYSVYYREDSDNCLETDHTEYTTPGGEKLHILCKYGYQ